MVNPTKPPIRDVSLPRAPTGAMGNPTSIGGVGPAGSEINPGHSPSGIETSTAGKMAPDPRPPVSGVARTGVTSTPTNVPNTSSNNPGVYNPFSSPDGIDWNENQAQTLSSLSYDPSTFNFRQAEDGTIQLLSGNEVVGSFGDID